MTDPNQMIKDFAEQVADEFPDLRQILDQARRGNLSETDALRAMTEVLASHPDLARRFQQVAIQALTPICGPEDRARPLDHGGLVHHKPRGLPQLDPLYEAALIERAQFDGDIPELRTGPLPDGVRPAVSVTTDARSPEALGQMLRAASDVVAEKVTEADGHRRQLVQQVAEGDITALVPKTGTTPAEMAEHVLDGKADIIDPPEYRRGAVPAPVSVSRPTGSALLAMTPEERRQSAWQFLSTTQGRRTALEGLRDLIVKHLQAQGLNVVSGGSGLVLATARWTVSIAGCSTQAGFSLVDVAAAVLAKNLGQDVGDRPGRLVLEVATIDTVADREVGWSAQLLAADKVLDAGSTPQQP